MPALVGVLIGVGVALLALGAWVAVGYLTGRDRTKSVPATDEPHIAPDHDAPAVELEPAPQALPAPEHWQAPDPTPTTASPTDDGVIWTPDPFRATREPAYFHQVDDLLAQYLPNGSMSDLFVFEDHDGRWIASHVYDFATRTRQLRRTPIPPTEPLP